MFGLDPPVAVAIGAAVWSTGCALWAARAWPIAMRRGLRAVQDRVLTAEANVESLVGKWNAKAAELAAWTEEAEGLLESVERKRRRIAASESAARGPRSNGEDDDPDAHRLELTRRARALGIPV